jgi:ABC-type lipoprotein release transport system permease subunit
MAVVLLSVIIIFLLTSVLFISSSLHNSLFNTLEVQSDFVVTKIKAGEVSSTPIDWSDELLNIYGISKVTPRVYGRYFFKSKKKSFFIVGIDFLEEQSHKILEKLMAKTDIKSFLKENKMLVGEGVKNYLALNYYENFYQFLTPNGVFKKVKMVGTLPSQANLITNDMIIMPIELAQSILGYSENEVSDVAFNVVNPDEWENIANKVSALHYDLRIVSKDEVKKLYQNLFNYKGGLFLSLFLVVLITFSLILYQRYNMVYTTERRHIGLLRAMGWSINHVLKLKFLETLTLLSLSFILGVVFAYIYVFLFNAPWLGAIFLGAENLKNSVELVPVVKMGVLSSIFFIYAIPFIASVLIPVWRVSITDAKEAML